MSAHTGVAPTATTRARGRDEGAAGYDDLVACADAEGAQCELERERAVRERDRVLPAERLGVLGLEAAALLADPVVELAGGEHLGDGSDLLGTGGGPPGSGAVRTGGRRRWRAVRSRYSSEGVIGRAGTPALGGVGRYVVDYSRTRADDRPLAHGARRDDRAAHADERAGADSTPPHTPDVGPMCAWAPMRQSWSTVQLVLSITSSPMRASTLTTTPAAIRPSCRSCKLAASASQLSYTLNSE